MQAPLLGLDTGFFYQCALGTPEALRRYDALIAASLEAVGCTQLVTTDSDSDAFALRALQRPSAMSPVVHRRANHRWIDHR